MYDKELYEAYGYQLDEGDEKLRNLERAYETAPTLHNLGILNTNRMRSGRTPIFDRNYGNLMQDGIQSLLRNTSKSIDGNYVKINGHYAMGSTLLPVTVLVHHAAQPHEVLRISFGYMPSILFDVHRADGEHAYFAGRVIPNNSVIKSWWYISSPSHTTNPRASEPWLYSPQALLKWLRRELDAFTKSGTSNN